MSAVTRIPQWFDTFLWKASEVKPYMHTAILG
jgi:hypothetical protein